MSVSWQGILSDDFLTRCGAGCRTLEQFSEAVARETKQQVSRDALFNAHRRHKRNLGLKSSLTDYMIQEPETEKDQEDPPPRRPEDIKFWLDNETRKNLKKTKRFIITSAMNNCNVHDGLWKSIERYAKKNNAQILVVPVRYRNPTSPPEARKRDWNAWWDKRVQPFATDECIKLHPKLWLMAHVRVQATAVNPLSGLDALSSGASSIFGHSQLAMKMVATPQNSHPKVMYTTMSCTEPRYSDTKAGIKGEFHHQMGALVVELDGSRFHIRNLCADAQGGFYDLESYYGPDGIKPTGRVSALVVGDEHVMFNDRKCRAATFTSKDSICSKLKPEKIIRHDVFDGYSISHWNRKDPIVQYSKHRLQHHLVEKELTQTIKHIDDTTPRNTENLVVSSNHHDHLLRWMKDVHAPTQEPWNAKIWLELWQDTINTVHFTESGVSHMNPLAIWAKKRMKSKCAWLMEDSDAMIHDIAIGMHGHAGINGSRGTLNQFSKIGVKSVIGHSHTPGIKHGAFQVGTSSKLKLEYTKGPSSWANCHCIIYPNGKRQLIFVINGSWRA